MKAIWNNTIIAESADTVLVEGNPKTRSARHQLTLVQHGTHQTFAAQHVKK